MKHTMKMRALLFSLALLPLRLLGAEEIKTGTEFVLQKQCDLYTSAEAHKGTPKSTIKTPDPQATDYKNPNYVFKKYQNINKKEYILISGAFKEKGKTVTKEYLLLRDCGNPVISRPTLTPIFSSEDYSRLDTPEFKNSLDSKILEFCGKFTNQPTKESLKAILMDEKFNNEVNTIYKNIEGKELALDGKNAFMDKLIQIFFERNGIMSSVCGTVTSNSFVGVSYYYRLLQLDREGFIGKADKNCAKTSETPGIENISVKFINANNTTGEKCSITFVKNHTIVDIFSIGGMIDKAIYADNSNSCTYKYKNIPFNISYEKKQLITLYPLAVTDEKCKGDKCKCTF